MVRFMPSQHFPCGTELEDVINMQLDFRHIDEKDIDMLIMDRVSKNGAVLDLIVQIVSDEIPGDLLAYELESITHSAATRNGESDLVIVLAGKNSRHAILIEDKIDAPAQPQQAKRYKRRGDEGIAAGDWSNYSVLLMAPEEYLLANSEPYPHELSYQQIREALPKDDEFGRKMLSCAIVKQQSKWQPSRDEVMSAFYDEVALTAKKMRVKADCWHKVGDSRAEGSGWVDFRSPLADTGISWKSNQGVVVLGFYGWGSHVDELKQRVGAIPDGTYWRPPKKSAKVAYLCLDALYKVEDWKEAATDAPLIVDVLYKVQRLYDFAIELSNRVIDWGVPS